MGRAAYHYFFFMSAVHVPAPQLAEPVPPPPGPALRSLLGECGNSVAEADALGAASPFFSSGSARVCAAALGAGGGGGDAAALVACSSDFTAVGAAAREHALVAASAASAKAMFSKVRFGRAILGNVSGLQRAAASAVQPSGSPPSQAFL